MKNSKKSIIFNILFVLMVVIICLLLAEVFSRIYLHVSGKGGYVHLPDDYLGRVHAPNSHFVFEEDFSKEFKVKRKTNSLGLIGEEIVIEKPQDIFRILVLGDSFTEALQVEEGKNFCEQLQHLLNENIQLKNKYFEVLNAGISGYSPISEYLYFKKELLKLKADLVILQLFANDVFEDNKVGAMSVIDRDGFPLKINRFFIRRYLDSSTTDYKVSKLQDYFYRIKRFILSKSRFSQVIARAIRKLYKRSRFHQEMTSLPEFNDANQFFIIQKFNPLFRDRNFRDSAWEKTKKYILAIKQLVEKYNADFLIMFIPPEAQLELEMYGVNTRLYFSERRPNFYLNTLLKRLSREENIDYLDLLSLFEKNKTKGLYFNKDGHLTEEGHKVVAEALFDFLVQNNLFH